MSHTPTPDNTSPERRGLSRRTMLAATAWTAPVIAVSVATPAAAASGILRGSVEVYATPGCHAPGASLPTPFARAYASSGGSAVPIVEAEFAFWSDNGATVIVGGETYPGSSVPLTRTATGGEVFLDGVTPGAVGLMNVGVYWMRLEDGRTISHDEPGFLNIC